MNPRVIVNDILYQRCRAIPDAGTTVRLSALMPRHRARGKSLQRITMTEVHLFTNVIMTKFNLRAIAGKPG